MNAGNEFVEGESDGHFLSAAALNRAECTNRKGWSLEGG